MTPMTWGVLCWVGEEFGLVKHIKDKDLYGCYFVKKGKAPHVSNVHISSKSACGCSASWSTREKKSSTEAYKSQQSCFCLESRFRE